MSLAERFWPKVDKSPATGCWHWTGSLDRKGYGSLRFPSERIRRAHRASWLLHFGHPGAALVCHRCDNPKCVNPAHLFLGTTDDNMKDAAAKGRLPGPHWSNHNNRRLDPDKVREIRTRYAAGETQQQLADFFGVAVGTIHYIVRRTTWKHVA